MPGVVSRCQSVKLASRIGLPSKMGEKPKVCRNLFGKPDHDELRKELDELNKASQNVCRERWNFDTEHDMPLEGRYEWIVAEPTEYVPSVYTKGYSSRRRVSAVRRISNHTDSVMSPLPVVWSSQFVASTPQSPVLDNSRISREELEKTPENRSTSEETSPLVQTKIEDFMPKRKRSDGEDSTSRKARRLDL